jgi:hypothetical protein
MVALSADGGHKRSIDLNGDVAIKLRQRIHFAHGLAAKRG